MPTELRNYQGSLLPPEFPLLPADWKSESDTFPGSAPSLHLFDVHHQTTSSAAPWRSLFVLHGMGEHGGRYLHFPHYLQGTVGSVFCLDQRGHGRSEGLRGHIDQFSTFVDDVALGLERLQANLLRRYGRAEIHFLGHSFGGLVGLHLLHHPMAKQLKSATISAPLLGIRVPVPFAKKLASRALNHLWGTLQMRTGFDASFLAHDPAVVAAYRADRLVHDKITPRMFWELNDAMDSITKRALPESVPVQFLIPLQDHIVSAEATQKFVAGLKAGPYLRLVSYPDFYHESFNEIGKEKAFQDLNLWIQQHSSTH